MGNRNTSNTVWLFFLGCALFSVYWLGLYGPFLLDDTTSILPAQVNNLTWDELLVVSLNNTTGPLGRPISVASFALTSVLLGPDPFWHKLVNLFLHIGISALFFYWVRRLLVILGTAESAANTCALFAVALWALHPLQVSTVLYAVQRMSQLSVLFTLLGLMGYTIARQRLQEERAGGLLLMCLSYLIFLPLAALSKESGVLFPLYILVLEAFVFRWENASHRGFVAFLGLGVLLPILAGIFYYLLHFQDYTYRFASYGFSFIEHFLTEARVLFFYAKLIFMPRLTEFALFHDDFPVSHFLDPQTTLAFFGLGMSILLALFCRYRYPVLSLGIMWFLCSHALESSILPLELVFEHRNYFGSMGLLLIPAYVLTVSLKTIFPRPLLIRALMICCLVILTAMTAIRSYTWSDETLFLAVSLQDHPNSPRAHGEWANVLLRQGDLEGGLAQLRSASTLAPHNSGTVLHQLLVHCAAPPVPKMLLSHSLQRLENDPMTPYTLNTLENIIRNALAEQCTPLSSISILSLTEAALNNLHAQKSPHWLSLLYIMQARAFLLNEQPEKAMEAYNNAFHTYPPRVHALIEKATIQVSLGDIEGAESSLSAIALATEKQWVQYSHDVNRLRYAIDEKKEP